MPVPGWRARFLIAHAKPRAWLVCENLCLRQQLAVLKRQRSTPRLRDRDRRFRVLASRWFSCWRQCLILAKPETVLRWHQRGWKAYWRWRCSSRTPGRKRMPLEVRELIRRIARENPLWGQIRIMAELLKLGLLLSPRTVRKYLRRPWSGIPSPHWRAFLEQHAKHIWACDFCCVRTLTFQTLYVVLHDRARHPGDRARAGQPSPEFAVERAATGERLLRPHPAPLPDPRPRRHLRRGLQPPRA